MKSGQGQLLQLSMHKHVGTLSGSYTARLCPTDLACNWVGLPRRSAPVLQQLMQLTRPLLTQLLPYCRSDPATRGLLCLEGAAHKGSGVRLSLAAGNVSMVLSDEASKGGGALTLEHLLQLGLAADGGAAGGRAGRPHRDGAGRVGAARSGAAGRDEALAIPALTEGQLGRAAEAV